MHGATIKIKKMLCCLGIRMFIIIIVIIIIIIITDASQRTLI